MAGNYSPKPDSEFLEGPLVDWKEYRMVDILRKGVSVSKLVIVKKPLDTDGSVEICLGSLQFLSSSFSSLSHEDLQCNGVNWLLYEIKLFKT